MRLLMVIAILIFAMPMTGFGCSCMSNTLLSVLASAQPLHISMLNIKHKTAGYILYDFMRAEGTNILLDPNLMCKKTRRLRGKLAEICRHDSMLLKEIINGINLGFRECEYQFRNRRWNCTILRRSMRKILMKDTRETSFVNAITAAGVTYAVTKSCTLGNLIECSCDKSHSRRNGGQLQMVNAATAVAALERQQAEMERNLTSNTRLAQKQQHRQKQRNGSKRKLLRNLKFPEGEWEWGGCSDNVNFGFRNSRVFLDAKYRRRSDLRTLVRVHNNNAGRLAIRDSMRLDCKCHGLSGSCTVKTCWLKMPPFREVAERLRDKFDNAAKVVLRNDGNSFMPEDPDRRKPPGKYDLVFTDDSSDFCTPNPRTGSMGTQDRECNATSLGHDSCDLLCCGRGHKHRVVMEQVNCKCVFKWCCDVTCQKCWERREINTCL